MGRHSRPESVNISIAFSATNQPILVWSGIRLLRRYFLRMSTASFGLSTIPIHLPFTKTFVLPPTCRGNKSPSFLILIFLFLFVCNHSIILSAEVPDVMEAAIDMCLCSPTFPPSGVSSGSIIPHCDEWRWRGATTLALASISRLTLRRCDIAELKVNRFRSCTIPTRFVCTAPPQSPFNARFMPDSTILSEK